MMGMAIGALIEIPWRMVLGLVSLLLLSWWVFRMLEWAWFKPRRLARLLRAQGLRGTSYRFLSGDVKEQTRLNQEAKAKAMPFSHDIAPRVAPFLHRAMKENGKISVTWFGPTPRVTLTDPELVREVLSNKFGHFGKSVTPLGRLLVDGLLNHEGEKWVRHRRILNPAFHMEKLKRMLPSFSTCCTELISRWESSVASDGSYELDVWPEFKHLTGDVISRTAFGSNYKEGRQIFVLLTELTKLVVVQVSRTAHIPGYRFLPTRDNKRMRKIDREIRELLRGIIGKREKAIKDGEANNDDLLGLLLESNMKYFEDNGKSYPKMTTEDVIEECKLFYFAGQETTTVLLTWTIVVLGMHPSWQVRAREEVLQVFGKNKPDFEGLSRLKIVRMILYEVLRLYPPAILLSRITYKPMELGDIVYPPGVLLSLPVVFIHHDPDIWGEDANEFRPERFAEGISKASKDQVAFFPFGGGPRICIGQNFALLEAKLALSMILQHFSFELSPSYIHAPHTVGTLHPQHGVQIILHRF